MPDGEPQESSRSSGVFTRQLGPDSSTRTPTTTPVIVKENWMWGIGQMGTEGQRTEGGHRENVDNPR